MTDQKIKMEQKIVRSKVAFATLGEPDFHPQYNKRGTWEVSLINLDENPELFEYLSDLGLEDRFETVEDRKMKAESKGKDKFYPDIGTRLQLRRYARSDEGKANTPPVVRDANNNEVKRDWLRTGTLANVAFTIMDLPPNRLNPSGKGLRFDGVQILDEPKGSFDPDSLFSREQEYAEELGEQDDIFGDMS